MTRMELSPPTTTVPSGPEDLPGALLEKASLSSEIGPWWFAPFVPPFIIVLLVEIMHRGCSLHEENLSVLGSRFHAF